MCMGKLVAKLEFATSLIAIGDRETLTRVLRWLERRRSNTNRKNEREPFDLHSTLQNESELLRFRVGVWREELKRVRERCWGGL